MASRLSRIKKVVGKDNFDKLAALYSHRNSLNQEWEKIKILLKTIDNTIKHLKGTKKMKDKEIFDGFNICLVKKTKGGKPYSVSEEIVAKSVRNPTENTEDVEKKRKRVLSKFY